MSEPKQKPGRSKQNYGTPWEFIAAVTARFGPIVCDLAADAENSKGPEHIDRERDSLSVSWAREYPTGTLWLNPPFGAIGPWAEKCKLESREREGSIVMLTPASIGSNWFDAHVHRHAMVFGLLPRLTFEGTTAPYPKDLMLSVFSGTRLGVIVVPGFDTWRWYTPKSKGPKIDPRQLPLFEGETAAP